MSATIEELEREQERLRAVMEANAARIAELRQARKAELERRRRVVLRMRVVASLKLRDITLIPRAWREGDHLDLVRVAVEIERRASPGFAVEISLDEMPQVISFLQRVQEIAEGGP